MGDTKSRDILSTSTPAYMPLEQIFHHLQIVVALVHKGIGSEIIVHLNSRSEGSLRCEIKNSGYCAACIEGVASSISDVKKLRWFGQANG